MTTTRILAASVAIAALRAHSCKRRRRAWARPFRRPFGPRVPLVIVSPYAKAGYTDSTPATFASILAYEEYVFSLAPLGPNDAAAYAFSNSFDYAQTPLAGIPMRQSLIPPGEHTVNASDDPT